MIGAVGYVYKEIGCDSGSGDHVGCFQSQVVGIGPQLGFIIPISTTTQHAQLRVVGGVSVFGQRDLRHLLNSCEKYYNEARTHLSVHKDAPIPRAVPQPWS